MNHNSVGKVAVSQPICPRPLYFNKSTPENQSSGASALFTFYCEQAGVNSSDAMMFGLQSVLHQNIFAELCGKEGLGLGLKSGITDINEHAEQQASDQKGEFMIEGSRLNVQQKNSYSKFLKRSTANDTKNIPKNFGKAIISFIQKNQKVTIRCIRRYQISLDNFIKELKSKKKILHSIRELRSLWLEQDFIYAKPFRELSHYFLRRAGHRYIFGSRVSDFGNHLKYRYRIMKALKCPKKFNSIKI